MKARAVVPQMYKPPLNFTPADLTPRLWLRADAANLTLNGSTVSAWSDLSGNGYNFTQATAAYQPVYEATGLNGKPCVRFDGTDDLMSCVVTPYISPASVKQVSTFLIFQQMALTTGAVQLYFYMASDNGSGPQYGLYSGAFTAANKMSYMSVISGNYGASYRANTVDGAPTTKAATLLSWFDQTMGYQAILPTKNTDPENKLLLNGRYLTQYPIFGSNGYPDNGSPNRATHLGGLPANNTVFGNVRIAEVVHVNRLLTETEKVKLAAYARERYGI